MALDSELLTAKFLLAFALSIELGAGWAADVDETRTTALALTEELLRRDSANANAHRLASRLYSILGRHTEALTQSERALALNPYDGDVLIVRAMALMQAGRADEAIAWVERALRYNPQPPAYYRLVLVMGQFLAGDYGSALESLRRVEGGLLPQSRFVAIAVLQVNGCHQEAAAAVDALLAEHPDVSIQSAAALFASYKDPAQVQPILDALRDAGMRD